MSGMVSVKCLGGRGEICGGGGLAQQSDKDFEELSAQKAASVI